MTTDELPFHSYSTLWIILCLLFSFGLFFLKSDLCGTSILFYFSNYERVPGSNTTRSLMICLDKN